MSLLALEDSLEGLWAGILPQRDPLHGPPEVALPQPHSTPCHSWDTSPDLP